MDLFFFARRVEMVMRFNVNDQHEGGMEHMRLSN